MNFLGEENKEPNSLEKLAPDVKVAFEQFGQGFVVDIRLSPFGLIYLVTALLLILSNISFYNELRFPPNYCSESLARN